jgi:hypothetical protein
MGQRSVTHRYAPQRDKQEGRPSFLKKSSKKLLVIWCHGRQNREAT